MKTMPITKCSSNKGFSGNSSILPRSSFGVSGQESNPQSLTAATLNRCQQLQKIKTAQKRLNRNKKFEGLLIARKRNRKERKNLSEIRICFRAWFSGKERDENQFRLKRLRNGNYCADFKFFEICYNRQWRPHIKDICHNCWDDLHKTTVDNMRYMQ